MDLSLIPKVDRVILALEDEDYNSLLLAERALRRALTVCVMPCWKKQFAQADKEEHSKLACSFTREFILTRPPFPCAR